mmetsp:Transcript_28839/g.49243  ORF Transcript_28839/g.49243 Transcript_28839/m.49243 type:complete len:215 (+) Transcript_28839:798-1442(+)
MRGKLHPDGRAPRDNVVVQLRKDLDEVQPVADERKAELTQVLLREKKDGAAVDVVREEGRAELPEPERVEPRHELVAVPDEDVAREGEHLQVGQPSDAGQVLRDRLAVQVVLVEVLVAPLQEPAVDLEAGDAFAGGALLVGRFLQPAKLEPHVALPHARALQLEVVRVAVRPVIAAPLHLDASDVHLGRALPRLVLHLVLEPQARPSRPAVAAL